VTRSRDRRGDAGRLPLIGGHLALDFANTAGWHAGPARLEHLTDYGELVGWARHAGTISASEATALAREAEEDPRGAARTLERVIALREMVYRILAAIAARRTPTAGDLAGLHEARVRSLRAARPEWRDGLALRWGAKPVDLLRPIHPVVIAAGTLLESEPLARLRQCGNHPCGWLFLDRSRNGTRRWCSSDDCGNLTRVRRFRDRRA